MDIPVLDYVSMHSSTAVARLFLGTDPSPGEIKTPGFHSVIACSFW